MNDPRRLTAALASIVAGALLANCAHLKPQPFTFVQLGDPQIGFEDYAADLARFQQAVDQINASEAEFVVICGDLVNKRDEQSVTDFNAAKARLRVPVYCAPGNHDIGNEPSTADLGQFRKSIGPDFFHFDHRGCRFLVLNAQLWKSPVPGETSRQDAWLHRILTQAARRQMPVFVVQHYPPFVKTPEEPEAYFNLPLPRRGELLRQFSQYGVKAILAGHTHTTSINHAGHMEVVTSETTSKNFDQRPHGYRVWQVSPGGEFRHSFVPLDTTRSAASRTESAQ